LERRRGRLSGLERRHNHGDLKDDTARGDFAFLSSTSLRKVSRQPGSSMYLRFCSSLRTEPSALSSKALLFEPTSPMLRVGALKGEHHDALEEFSQLEPLVAGLGACAGGHAVVGVGGLVRVVHLVCAPHLKKLMTRVIENLAESSPTSMASVCSSVSSAPVEDDESAVPLLA
jgi:hypothetical protein